MTKKENVRILFILVFLLLACSRTKTVPQITVGGVWEAPGTTGEIDWAKASLLAEEQHAGFELANEDAGFSEISFAEGNRKDEVQTAIRKLVEGQGADIEPVMAILGATTNEATTRSVALANFFQVPMVIPSASGNNLLPTTNLWAFQLSAPDAAYADHMLNTVLAHQVLGDAEEEFFPEMRIAVFYEQNTYGESAAVATAEAALAQGYEIVVYEKFSANFPDRSQLRKMINNVIDQDAQIVFLISNDPAVAQLIVQTFTGLLDSLSMPVIVGMAGGFTSQAFLTSDAAENVYVLRQKLDAADCPAEIKSLYAAQTYAAVKLLEYAVQESTTGVVEQISKLAKGSKTGSAFSKEAIRDSLKAADLELPCLGRIAFDTKGQNKYPRFEIVSTEFGKNNSLPEEAFVNIVKQKLGLRE